MISKNTKLRGFRKMSRNMNHLNVHTVSPIEIQTVKKVGGTNT